MSKLKHWRLTWQENNELGREDRGEERHDGDEYRG